MHEFSIVQSLIERVEQEARAHGATTVHALQVRVGEVSGVEVELLAKAFETFRAASLCAQAELTITAVPARWSCTACQQDIRPGELLRCPQCNAPARLVAGDEIYLDRIEMEVPDV